MINKITKHMVYKFIKKILIFHVNAIIMFSSAADCRKNRYINETTFKNIVQ